MLGHTPPRSNIALAAASIEDLTSPQSSSLGHNLAKRVKLLILDLQTLGLFRCRNYIILAVTLLFILSGIWVLREDYNDVARVSLLEDPNSDKPPLLKQFQNVSKLAARGLEEEILIGDKKEAFDSEQQQAEQQQVEEDGAQEQVGDDDAAAAPESIMIPDSYLYPSFPDRPDIFPDVDESHFHGRIGYTSDGKPFWSPMKPAFRMTREQKREAHRGYCFNTRVAASLELDRPVPDYNSQQCLNVDYEALPGMEELPAADVIIVFHNEDLSVLLRSIHSILNRSPPKLLRQIILVNDDSNITTHPWLFDELPRSLEWLPKTTLIHLTRRRGLMMARMEGTKLSKAEIAVYLDSHIECTKRWLEPILAEIAKDRKRIVTPMIHSIEPDNFEFESNAVSVVGFSWTLGQTHPDRPNDGFHPVESPVMAGGLFAANRQWFVDDLGGYDPEMKLYGGEEMEIGFKTWQCGGSIVALPCSRVGHIFRTDKYWKGQVYPVPYHEIVRNKRRTAEVWMDEYRDIAFMAMSDLPANMSLGPLDQVKSLRQKLNCKSFKWYLDVVYPELNVPNLKGVVWSGAISNAASNQCIDTLQNSKGGPIGPYGCHGLHGSQAFLLDGEGILSTAQSSFEACITSNTNGDELKSAKGCNQRWTYEIVESAPKLPPSFGGDSSSQPLPQGFLKIKGDAQGDLIGKCLTYKKKTHSLAMERCDEEDNSQLWQWVR